jgi:hypothetical protein
MLLQRHECESHVVTRDRAGLTGGVTGTDAAAVTLGSHTVASEDDQLLHDHHQVSGIAPEHNLEVSAAARSHHASLL